MNKEIFYSFVLSFSVGIYSLAAHVCDIEPMYDYCHQYSHEKHEFDSIPHHDGEFFPSFPEWIGTQLDKEDQIKDAFNKAGYYIGQYADPLTAGIDASYQVDLKSPDKDSDQR